MSHQIFDWEICELCGKELAHGGYCIKCGSKTLANMIREEEESSNLNNINQFQRGYLRGEVLLNDLRDELSAN